MGHEQGYPVMCRLLNVDVDIRNGVGPAGGRIIGWLPIVSHLLNSLRVRVFAQHSS